MTNSIRFALAAAALLAFAGCEPPFKVEKENDDGPMPPPVVVAPPAAPEPEARLVAEEPATVEAAAPGGDIDWGDSKVKFKDGADQTKFSLKAKPDGAKLVDGAEAELARYTTSAGKVKVKDPADVVLGYIVRANGRYKVEDPTQKVEQYKFLPQADGDWKLEDGADKLIYKVKKRDYGWEVEDPSEKSLYKIKVKDGKTSIRDAGDQTVLATKETIQSLAAACLAFDAIEDLRIRAALAMFVDRGEGK